MFVHDFYFWQISGKSLPPRTLSTSQHLMIDNSSHDIWFGLTSVSHFRPDQSDLTETMSVSRPNRVQRSGTNQVTAFDSEHSEENLKPDTRIPDTSPSSTLEHSSNHPLRSSQSSQQNNFISKPFLFTSDHDGVSSGGNTSGKSHSKINLNLNGDANHDVPSTSPFAPITSTSRISHILKRDISNDLELDYDTSPVKFYSRCSKHPLYLDQKGHFRADNKSRSRDSKYTLPYPPNTPDSCCWLAAMANKSFLKFANTCPLAVRAQRPLILVNANISTTIYLGSSSFNNFL